MKRKLVIICTILTIISCKQSTTLTENEKASIIIDIRMTFDEYYSDIRKSGLSAELKYFDNTSDFFWVPPGYSNSISYDSVATIIKENAPSSKSVDNSIDTLRIIPLSKELAAYTGRLNSTMIDTSGKAITFALVESGILIKRPNGWKLLSGQTAVLNQK